jgi:hypothetical protein
VYYYSLPANAATLGLAAFFISRLHHFCK